MDLEERVAAGSAILVAAKAAIHVTPVGRSIIAVSAYSIGYTLVRGTDAASVAMLVAVAALAAKAVSAKVAISNMLRFRDTTRPTTEHPRKP